MFLGYSKEQQFLIVHVSDKKWTNLKALKGTDDINTLCTGNA